LPPSECSQHSSQSDFLKNLCEVLSFLYSEPSRISQVAQYRLKVLSTCQALRDVASSAATFPHPSLAPLAASLLFSRLVDFCPRAFACVLPLAWNAVLELCQSSTAGLFLNVTFSEAFSGHCL